MPLVGIGTLRPAKMHRQALARQIRPVSTQSGPERPKKFFCRRCTPALLRRQRHMWLGAAGRRNGKLSTEQRETVYRATGNCLPRNWGVGGEGGGVGGVLHGLQIRKRRRRRRQRYQQHRRRRAHRRGSAPHAARHAGAWFSAARTPSFLPPRASLPPPSAPLQDGPRPVPAHAPARSRSKHRPQRPRAIRIARRPLSAPF
jgi:hypothetical protein